MAADARPRRHLLPRLRSRTRRPGFPRRASAVVVLYPRPAASSIASIINTGGAQKSVLALALQLDVPHGVPRPARSRVLPPWAYPPPPRSRPS